MARNQKMVGYSAEHAFNDTWTVRQNLRYMQLETQYRGIYGTGISASLPYVMDRASVISHERLNSFTVDNQAQATFSTADVSHTMLTAFRRIPSLPGTPSTVRSKPGFICRIRRSGISGW
ncbi:Ferrichrome-iron receptor [Dickeya dadantii 3937]|uniref:Ferrichrome-iron receptor n=1 Tax=Dickeya dadantii (strain 3937) TaxID=198628 RepID=E0SE90_DICD3|nr:Ferrichrome-iron receptor [Dickeya dadantii 3937]